MNETATTAPTGLVDAAQLREELFKNAARPPHVETIKLWGRQRKIPSVKLGRLVYFNIGDVRAAIETRHTIHRRQ